MEKSITHPSAAQPCAEEATDRIQAQRRREIDRAISRFDMLRGILAAALEDGSPAEICSAARIVGEDCCEIQAGMWRASR